MGVPATPSGFPLYLFPLRYKRMPLQSLTLAYIKKFFLESLLINNHKNEKNILNNSYCRRTYFMR